MTSNTDSNVDAALAGIQSLAAGGNFSQAVLRCEKLCAAHEREARPWFLLGAICGQTGDMGRAEECSRRALELDPGLVGAHRNLATVLMRQQRLPEAEAVLRHALTLHPGQAVLCYELGNVLQHQRKVEAAIAVLRRAVELAPDFCDALFSLGNLLLEVNDIDSGLACMRSCFASDSSFVQAKAMEALILERQGQADAAFRCLEPLLQQSTLLPVVANAFAAVSTHLGKEQEAIHYLTRTIAARETPDQRYPGLYQQLGRLQDRLGQYDQAFENYVQANQLAKLPDNAERFIQNMRDSERLFAKSSLAIMPHLAAGGDELIFIVGMPRSGTTLVEQILAAHSRVEVGGELPFLGQVARQLLPRLQDMDGGAGTSLCADDIRQYADQYRDQVRRHVGSAERITDKTPHNFQYLGLIQMLFPAARVVHCTRNPLDTCVSCYCNQFTGDSLAYTNDQASLGRVYARYRGLMTHWENTLALPILEVPYESVVADTRTWTENILAFCGLSWEDPCLEFYRVKRQVHTSSYDQVRQPVYRGSVDRWRHYEKHLGPLKAALGQWAERSGESG